MANFAHAPHQTQIVNLDQVETIKLEASSDLFQIHFTKQIIFHQMPQQATLAKWSFKTEAERNKILMKVLAKHGSIL
jgi:hypothetical protein